MFCPKCKLASADDARFCGHCGEPFVAAAQPGPSASSAAAAGAAAIPGGPATSAAVSGIADRIKNILLNPKTEWPVIEPEPTTVAQLYSGYIMPLAGLAALMSFLHLSVIGISLPFGGSFRTPLISGLILALVRFGFGLLGLFLVGWIINALAPTFAGVRDQRQALKTAAYAFTPAWLGSVLALLGGFGSLLQFLAGIYGIYLLYLGLPVLMKNNPEKSTSYTVTVVIGTIVMGILLGLLSAAVGGMNGMGAFASAGMSQAEQQQRAAAAVGGMLGGALGTDQKGKDNLSAAINNLAEAGKNMEQQQRAAAQNSAAATPAAPDAASAPQNAVAATAGLLTALGGAMAGGKHVEPVDFHTLEGILPSTLPDMPRSNAAGSSQQALGVKGSSASADYIAQSGGRASVKIADASGVAGLLDLATSMAAGTSSESDAGFERNATVAGVAVHEKFDNASKHGELMAIVAKRFTVEVTGDGLDIATLEKGMAAVDFSKLEALKDSGAQPTP